MKTDRKLLLVAQDKTYIKGEKESLLEETTDYNNATDYYPYLLDRYFIKKKAEKKFGKKYKYKKYIGLSGNIDIQNPIAFAKNENRRETLSKKETVFMIVVVLLLFALLVKEQGVGTAIVLMMILGKLFLTPFGEQNASNNEGVTNKNE